MTPSSLMTPEPLSSREKTDWLFWRVQTPHCWYLYAIHSEADQPVRAVHLGAFNDPGSLAAQQIRFLENPATTVQLPLDPEVLHAWLEQPQQHTPPPFHGQLGSAWSGYGVKPLEQAHQVEVIYAADLRHEWMGVFTEPEAFAAIEQHYDRRRSRCLIC